MIKIENEKENEEEEVDQTSNEAIFAKLKKPLVG